MKKRLNILCVLVILILLVTVSIHGYYSGVGAKLGFESAQKMHEKERKNLSANMHAIGLIPTSDNFLSDSIYNEKTGEYIPVSFTQAIVGIDAGFRPLQFISALLVFSAMGALVVVLVFFFKFVIAVNRSEIFVWINVTRLRWIGGLLILVFVSNLLPVIEANLYVNHLLKLKGYSVYFSEMVSVTSLLLGVLAYIIAEVFAIGIKMKEEQELTI